MRPSSRLSALELNFHSSAPGSPSAIAGEGEEIFLRGAARDFAAGADCPPLAAGVLTRVVPDDELQAVALQVASSIGEFSPLALRLGLEVLQTSADMNFEQSIQYMNSMRAIIFASEDMYEGASAFLEKRKPVWRGR